ncbi:MAG: PspC domain-containing protein [Bacteroidales bacterium]|nr:PspC domain-containing protein [Bacteroidales bacterium]
MEKTIKINIAGTIFQISEDGYELLREYLQSVTSRLKNFPDGSEMIDDIEARIAEIFQSGASWKTGVISKEEVEEMISTMGSADDIADGLESGDASQMYRSTKERKLTRDSENSILGGVCSGLGNYFRIDTIWIRIIFILFTLFYLSGLVIYAVLWIVLPRSTVGYSRASAGSGRGAVTTGRVSASDNRRTGEGSPAGNAVNDLFTVLGRIIIVFLRVILAIFGVTLVLTGFGLLISYIIIAFLDFPVTGGPFSNVEFFNLVDLLTFVVTPTLVPVMMLLMSLVVILPLAGMIYWGIRMVFQFRARDLILNVIMFSVWILACATLVIFMFSEGVSFANTGRTYEQMAIPTTDTLIISGSRTLTESDFDRRLTVPFEDNLTLYLNEEDKTIYGTPEVTFRTLDENAPYIQIVKYSQGKSRVEASKKADDLQYGYNINGNSVGLDNYFTIPAGNRWSGANLRVRVYVPEGMIIYIDEDIEEILDERQGKGVYSWQTGGRYWRVVEGGLEEAK